MNKFPHYICIHIYLLICLIQWISNPVFSIEECIVLLPHENGLNMKFFNITDELTD